MGFSTTTLAQHIGFHGQPLACRLASRDELKAYANVLKELGKGAIEIALTRRAGQVLDDEYQTARLSAHRKRAAGDLARDGVAAGQARDARRYAASAWSR